MPRKSKTQPANVTAPNQAYGVASDQKQAMNVVPLPATQVEGNMSAPLGPTVMSSGEVNAAPVETGASPDGGLLAALQAANQMEPSAAQGFSDPTTRPNESVFAMPNRPVTAPRNDVADILKRAAELSGNNQGLLNLAALVERSRY